MKQICITGFVILLSLAALPLLSEGQWEENILPMDPNAAVGTLENGVTYYIRENGDPANRAYLRLVVNAGSILEDDDQLGLAHLVEHMAFNGTEKYAESEIVDYLESIGMRFGPEINAYTSFDETVYMLQVPSDEPEKLERGFDILSQWAFHVSFDAEEVDKERGVIVEEWRTGLGAQDRLRQQQFPVLFKGSRYANRLPIGDMEIIRSFPHEVIKRYYEDWYRPELMAVVAVGDFEAENIYKLIEQFFGNEPATQNGRIRETYQVPDHQDTLFAIGSDPELGYTQVSIYNKAEVSTLSTEEDYRGMLVHRLYSRMINSRFSERAQGADPPFLAAGSGRQSLVRTKGINYLSAVVTGNDVKRGLESLIKEAKGVNQHGFTKSEFERARKEVMRGIEQAYTERENAKSNAFMEEYTRHFLNGEAAPGIEYEFALYSRLLPTITLTEVNAISGDYLKSANRAILVSTVAKEGFEPVEEDDLAAALNDAENAAVSAYIDEDSDTPLLPTRPVPGEIVSREYYEEVDITGWTLSNGATVYLKSTDFMSDQLLFSAFSPGGTSLYDESDYPSALYAASLVRDSGFGGHSAVALEKKLAGKRVTVIPYIDPIEEGLRGRSSLDDVETLFQLIYGYFSFPRTDDQAFANLIRGLKTSVQNRDSQPRRRFTERINELLNSNHYTASPLTVERIDTIDPGRAAEIYAERFLDADDFAFVFAGSIAPDDLEPFLTNYIAALPSSERDETWRDLGVERPFGIVDDSIRAGIEPQSQVAIIFHSDYEWSKANNHRLLSLAESLRIRLREVLREDESGTYGVSVRARFERYPRERYSIQIYFGTSPERAEELSDLAIKVVREHRENPPDTEYITKVKATQQEKYELDIRENSYWVANMKNAILHGRAFSSILSTPEYIAGLDAEDLLSAAGRYLDENRYIRVILYPDSGDTARVER